MSGRGLTSGSQTIVDAANAMRSGAHARAAMELLAQISRLRRGNQISQAQKDALKEGYVKGPAPALRGVGNTNATQKNAFFLRGH